MQGARSAGHVQPSNSDSDPDSASRSGGPIVRGAEWRTRNHQMQHLERKHCPQGECWTCPVNHPQQMTKLKTSLHVMKDVSDVRSVTGTRFDKKDNHNSSEGEGELE